VFLFLAKQASEATDPSLGSCAVDIREQGIQINQCQEEEGLHACVGGDGALFNRFIS
jgi:hypothetical protein